MVANTKLERFAQPASFNRFKDRSRVDQRRGNGQSADSKIIIADPEPNPDELNTLGYSNTAEIECLMRLALAQLAAALRMNEITQFSHPQIIDVGAGNGSLGKIAHDLGWPPSKITHLDRFYPTHPLLPQAYWIFLDLELLRAYLQENQALDNQVEALRGTFDIFVCAQVPLHRDTLLELASFLLLPADPSGRQSILEAARLACFHTKDLTVIVRG